MFGLNTGPAASRFVAGFAAALMLAGCGVIGEFGDPSKRGAGVSRERVGLLAVAPQPARARASDVVPLPDGDTALDFWLAAIDAADETIDIQTFIYRPDPVGRLISGRLADAADRGVRVRVLVDDLFHFWKGHDLKFLDRHNGIAVKVFNPLDRNLPPPFNYLLEYDRVDARMHGKALIIDGDTAIVGGRNVGAEYFRRDADDYFSDFEVLVRGEASDDIRAAFDRFWSDPLARDYAEFAPGQAPHPRRSALGTSPDITEPRQTLGALLDRHGIFGAEAVLHMDTPDKVRGDTGIGGSIASEGALSALSEARESVLIVTPYFIPGDEVTEVLIGLARRGVRLRVVTNSLGSTNHPSVHAGYLKHRKRLLNAGVEIFEYRPGVVRRYQADGRRHAPVTTLHSKVMLIDGTTTITGSMNFDERSLHKNSELLVELTSPSLHRWIEDWSEEVLLTSSYALRLAEDGKVVWEAGGPSGRTLRRTEPNHDLGSVTVSLLFALTGLESAL